MCFLIANLYSSQCNAANADARLVSIGEARATEIAEFLMSARQPPCGSQPARISPIISAILISECPSDMGYSPIWLQSSDAFSAILDEEKYQGQLAYLRLAFFDRNSVARVDVGASSAPTLSPKGNPAEPSFTSMRSIA